MKTTALSWRSTRRICARESTAFRPTAYVLSTSGEGCLYPPDVPLLTDATHLRGLLVRVYEYPHVDSLSLVNVGLLKM